MAERCRGPDDLCQYVNLESFLMKNKEKLIEYRITGTFPLGKHLNIDGKSFIITKHSGQRSIVNTGQYSVMKELNHPR